jgi:hypothetical protein
MEFEKLIKTDYPMTVEATWINKKTNRTYLAMFFGLNVGHTQLKNTSKRLYLWFRDSPPNAFNGLVNVNGFSFILPQEFVYNLAVT